MIAYESHSKLEMKDYSNAETEIDLMRKNCKINSVSVWSAGRAEDMIMMGKANEFASHNHFYQAAGIFLI